MSQLALLPSAETLPPEKMRQAALSQWFTPADTATKLVEWIGLPRLGSTFLEPSAGSGRLVRAIEALRPGMQIDAVEIDPRYAAQLEGAGDRVRVDCTDYLTRPPPPTPYDFCVMNPPYEDGLDRLFLAKAMAESRRVVALVRLAALEGAGRYEAVWSRIVAREWRLVGLAVFVSRPVFDAGDVSSDGGKVAFVALKLSRSHEDEQEPRTAVEWWT